MGLKFCVGMLLLAVAAIVICNEENEEDGEPPNMEGCGISKTTYTGSKIVGGRDALVGECPWQGSLEMQMVPLFTEFEHICGASILNKNWAITAAHCIAGSYFARYRIVAAAHNISTKIAIAKSKVIPFVHEGYNPVTSLKNDIALLRLTTPLPLETSDGYINGVCLPPASRAGKCEGIATVTGWGTTSEGGELSAVLQSVDVPIVHRQKCQEAYGDMIEDTMICAGYEEGGRDSCQGDSGGPLVQRSPEGVSTLVGIVSWGRGCAQAKYPGVYTDTAHYIPWIIRTMQMSIIPANNGSKLNEGSILP